MRDRKVHVVKGAEPDVLKHEMLHAATHPNFKETTRGFSEFNEAMTERMQWGMKGGGVVSMTPPMREALQKANPPQTLESYMWDFKHAMYPPAPPPPPPPRK